MISTSLLTLTLLMMMIFLLALVVRVKASLWTLENWGHNNRECAVLFNERSECGHYGINKEQCLGRGCCWRQAPDNRHGTPWCFFPQKLGPAYYVSERKGFPGGDQLVLTHRDPSNDHASSPLLIVKVESQTDLIHITINGPPEDHGPHSNQQCSNKADPYHQKGNGAASPLADHTFPVSSKSPHKHHHHHHHPHHHHHHPHHHHHHHHGTHKGARASPKKHQSSFNRINHHHPQVPPVFYKAMPGYPMPKSDWIGDWENCELQLSFDNDPFQFHVTRRSDASVLFSTAARDGQDPFNSIIFKGQYVEIGTRLSPGHYIYGLGERVGSFRRKPHLMVMNARDIPAAEEQNNLYGAHPFYLEVRPDSRAHGVLMLNSHPMEVELTENALVYHMLGGAIDMYFFAGPTPDDVLEQYTRIVGRPPLIESKYFGIYQSRFGYNTLKDVQEVVHQYEKNELPLDGIFLDINYMEGYDDFTIDPIRYPHGDTLRFVREQHSQGRSVVPILDPGITIKESLPAYVAGKAVNVFLRTSNNEEYYEGRVWPGPVHFIDFLAPQAHDYWLNLVRDFYQKIPFDGLWLDMNEPACFGSGHRGQHPTPPPNPYQYNLNYPPYAINNGNSQVDIFMKTIAMDVRHHDNAQHISLHNVYGLSESFRTAEVLEKLQPNQRHFLLTRSTFPGSGRFTAHWLGDNRSDFKNMHLSISGIFDFQLFGIPMVGADICGFLGATDEELCARWMALGAFYPFARNHNAELSECIPQEPYRWKVVAEVTRKYYGLRYSIISYWYTLYRLAHESGRAIIRPLFFEFPHLTQLYDNDEQFMVGSALLVIPVLKRGAQSVTFHLPPGVWYDIVNLDFTPLLANILRTVTHYADIKTMPVLMRGGNVLFRQKPALTIRDTITEDYEMIIALNVDSRASGMLYLDDGHSSDPGDNFTKVQVSVICIEETCIIKTGGHFKFFTTQVIKSLTIVSPKIWLGTVRTVLLAGRQIFTTTITLEHKIIISGLSVSLNQPQELQISCN